MSATHAGVAADLAANFPKCPVAGPGAATVLLADDEALTRTVDRTWKLAMSLPPTPLVAFEAAVAGLPQTTEAERLVVQRIGQDKFRDALMFYWSGRCPMTGITDPALLRASHIIPWAACATDAERLDASNGLLLSSLWDAAFDAGLVAFEDDGRPIPSARLTPKAAEALGIASARPIPGLTPGHRARLAVHRAKTFQGVAP
ncbi:MAG: HNH endonuclease [Phenylobacterium sp.]|uniref:HNH endonuclease n=1 Tax=Phenylobacterium sp. TaxID=1871053 RepID=UPI0012101B92|nr:HNH endonuclease signature motif containing protein [Phenylobacterium sp.]TAL32096.1 MAG: HNH endonuclease [Phenylobacterium sp.]